MIQKRSQKWRDSSVVCFGMVWYMVMNMCFVLPSYTCNSGSRRGRPPHNGNACANYVAYAAPATAHVFTDIGLMPVPGPRHGDYPCTSP